MLGVVRSELRHLSAVVTEIVELATETRDEAIHERLDLADVATVVTEELARRGDGAIEVEAAWSPVVGDRAALERAVANLLGNARKHGDPDGPIRLVVAERTVTVLDRGPGIPEDDVRRIFARFHRSHVAQDVPGSGLGLAIVAKIVDEHDGEVFARNRADGGAAVGFSLPAPATS